MKAQKYSSINMLKIGIIGCGKMGKHHIRAISLQDCAKIVGIADPLIEQADLGDLLPADIKVFSSAEEFLNKATPDVVHIVTPPSTHAKLAKLVLNNGAHVYLEKPFTLNKTDAEDIFTLAEERELYVCAGHQVLLEDPAIKARACLKEIGKLIHIESYFSFRTVRKNITPVDQLIDILPHPTCLLLSFMQNNSNSPVELEAISENAKGEVRGILRSGETYGSLIVTLQGRPVESYVRIVGTNGSIFADFVRGTVVKLPGPGASAISAVFNTYSQATQLFWKPTKHFAKMAFKKHKSYPGLAEIIKAFYSNILNNSSPPVSPASTIATVSLCERICRKLKSSEAIYERIEAERLKVIEDKLPPLSAETGVVLVTGGTGFLGRKVAKELRNSGFPVRIFARNTPPCSKKLPGVEYKNVDLGATIPEEFLEDVTTIVHCAAETAGGKKEHERNTILATRNILNAAIKGNVKKIINISSIAVMKTSQEVSGPLDENTPIDMGNLSRGPYVWGKAEAEHLACDLGKKNGIDVKVIRLGPLVDFNFFEAPGRLGKEVGPLFVAVGSKNSKLSLCDVHKAAKVILYYASSFKEAPPILNLVEPTPPTRGELVTLLKKARPDLKCVWLPAFFLKVASPFLKILQRIFLPGKKPIDIVAVFSTESYQTDLAAEIIRKAD